MAMPKDKAELEKERVVLKSQLDLVESELRKPSQETITDEEPALAELFRKIVLRLVVYILVSLVLLVLWLVITRWRESPARARSWLELAIWIFSEGHDHLGDYILAAISGVLGSAISALLSINTRFANGLEFSDGTQYPDQDRKKERFNRRLAPGFRTRPLLGAFTGFLLIPALQSHFFGELVHLDSAASPSRIVFWGMLGGLFAKNLLDKLKEVFKNLLGKSE